MGTGSSNQNKVVKLNIPVIQLSGQKNNPTLQNFNYEGSQKLIVSDPFSQVESNYSALKNMYKDQKLEDSTTGIKVVHGLVGFQNLGNTCYFNAALHCLANTQPLMDYFLSKLNENEINKTNPLGTKGEVSTVFGKFICEVWRGSRSVGIVKQTNEDKNDNKMLSNSRSPQKKKQSVFEESISPKELILTVTKFSSMFHIGQQEDCQELLAYLLDMIHEDLNRCPPLKTPLPPEKSYYGQEVKEEWAAEQWSNHLQTSKSVIVDVFQGQLKSTLQCTECGMKSHKFEAFLFLSLPIPKPKSKPKAKNSSRNIFDTMEDQMSESAPQGITTLRLKRMDTGNKNESFIDKSIKSKSRKNTDSPSPRGSFESPYSKPFICSLQDCLQLFSIKETLTGSSQWSCPSCKHNVDATKRIQLWKLPNVLIIHIKRFEYSQRGGKINAEVQFPLDDLDLTDFVCSPQKEQPLYTLYAVAQHQGQMTSGHYTAAARNRNDGQWYWYNDHQMMQVVDINALIVNQYAYVLFYQKKTSENIFRQTLSCPDKWPHFTIPQQLSQTMQLKFSPQLHTSPKNANLLIVDDCQEENEIQGVYHVRQSQRSQTQIGSQKNIQIDGHSGKQHTTLEPSKFSFFEHNNKQPTSHHTKNNNSRVATQQKSIYSKQSQDNIFFAEADLRNIQKDDSNTKSPGDKKFEIMTEKMIVLQTQKKG